jgi:hypothetical protein
LNKQSSSFPSCSSAYETPHKHFNDSWTTLFGELEFCFAYLDDILVFSWSLEEHEQHLRTFFNLAKCVFKGTKITFLGYKSVEGSRPLEEWVAHLQDCPPPKTIGQLCCFLGMLNFFRQFLSQAADTQAPLHDVLSGPRVKRLSSHCLHAGTPQDLRRVQSKLVTCHATGAPRAISATYTRHRCLHYCHGCHTTTPGSL